jgi:hypothetical protein
MKVQNLDVTLEWLTISELSNLYNFNLEKGLPSYNITVKDENENILYNEINSNTYDDVFERRFEINDPIYCRKPKLIAGFNKNLKKSIFKYNFSDNYKKYKEIKNKIGFFKKLVFYVDYNNDQKADFIEHAEFQEIEDLDKNTLFNKIYRSSDYLSIKMLINKEYFNLKNIYSFLILGEVSNKIIKNKKLLNLFTENMDQQWLDVNDKTALLTVPFIESDIVEMSENINIKIIPLNFLQTEIYKFLRKFESEIDINNLYQEYFPNQCFNIGKIYKQAVNNETMIFYQNYIYLFNKDSIETNSSQTDLNINDMVFNKYFPLLNKDQSNKTICLSDDLNTDDVLDNAYNLEKNYLGYYAKDLMNYEDVAIDIDYLQNQGIKSVKILEIEELNYICNIYIEFITSFYNNEKFYIETSNNLKFYEKYKTPINNQEYITFLFKYSYELQSLNQYLSQNTDINKNQIISEKDLINFSAKLIL